MVLKKIFKEIGKTLEESQYILTICLAACFICGGMVMAGCLMSNDAILYMSIILFIEAGILSVIAGVVYTLYDIIDK